ncbi:hypothetical protein HRbin28_01856 [bacterium HR28]|nr:hypothetical protein HRbin28_01856 [bacterium HR28]
MARMAVYVLALATIVVSPVQPARIARVFARHGIDLSGRPDTCKEAPADSQLPCAVFRQCSPWP